MQNQNQSYTHTTSSPRLIWLLACGRSFELSNKHTHTHAPRRRSVAHSTFGGHSFGFVSRSVSVTPGHKTAFSTAGTNKRRPAAAHKGPCNMIHDRVRAELLLLRHASGSVSRYNTYVNHVIAIIICICAFRVCAPCLVPVRSLLL